MKTEESDSPRTFHNKTGLPQFFLYECQTVKEFGVVGGGAGRSDIVVFRVSEKKLHRIALSEQTKNIKIVWVDFDSPFPLLARAVKNLEELMAEERKKIEDFVCKRQLPEVTGYAMGRIEKILRKGPIIPCMTHRRKDGTVMNSFYSQDQLEQLKELRAEQARQRMLFETS